MPAGTPVEQTAAVLHELGAYLATVPEVTDYQAYAGTAAPINFNGLVRQYYLRSGGEVGDIQVNLVDKHHRSEQSHAIATRVRPALQQIGRALRRQRQGRRSAAGPAGAVADRRRDLRPGGAGPPRGRQGGARGVRQDRGRGRRRRQQHRRRAEDAAAGRPPQGRDARRAAGGHRQHAARRPGRRGHELPARREQVSRPRRRCSCPPSSTATSTRCCSSRVRTASGKLVPDPRAGHRRATRCASSRSTTRTCCR